MKRLRKSLLIVLALSIVLSLAACVNGGTGTTTATTKAAGTTTASPTTAAVTTAVTTGGVKTTVDFLLTYPKEKVVLYQLLDRFTKDTGYPLNIMYMPLDDAKKQINVMVAGKSLPDVLDIDGIDGAAYAAMGICVDITAKVNAEIKLDQYYEGPIAFSKYNGKFYSLPFTTNNICLYYNKDLFTAAGLTEPPATWSKLFEYAGKLTKNGVLGFGMAGIKNSDTTFQWLPMLWQAGGSLDKFNAQATKDAMAFYKSFVDAGYMSKEMINLNAGDNANNFIAGKVAMIIDGPWRLSAIGKATFKWGVAAYPEGPSGKATALGGHNLTITSTDNVNGAWELLKFFNQPDVMQKFGEADNYLPSRKDVAANSTYFNEGNMGVFMKMAEFAKPRGPMVNYPQFDSALQSALQAVLLGQKTIDAAVAEVAAVIK